MGCNREVTTSKNKRSSPEQQIEGEEEEVKDEVAIVKKENEINKNEDSKGEVKKKNLLLQTLQDTWHPFPFAWSFITWSALSILTRRSAGVILALCLCQLSYPVLINIFSSQQVLYYCFIF